MLSSYLIQFFILPQPCLFAKLNMDGNYLQLLHIVGIKKSVYKFCGSLITIVSWANEMFSI